MKDYETHFVSAVHDREFERQRKRRRIQHDEAYKKHLIFLATYPSGYPSGAYLREPWRDSTRKPRVVRCYRARRSKHIKVNCNRRFRRTYRLSESFIQRGSYRKATEFWWEYD